MKTITITRPEDLPKFKTITMLTEAILFMVIYKKVDLTQYHPGVWFCTSTLIRTAHMTLLLSCIEELDKIPAVLTLNPADVMTYLELTK